MLQHYDWSLLSTSPSSSTTRSTATSGASTRSAGPTAGGSSAPSSFDERCRFRAGTEVRVDDIGPVGLDNTDRRANSTQHGRRVRRERKLDRRLRRGDLEADRPADGDRRRCAATGTASAPRRSAARRSWSGTVKDHGLAPKIGVNYEVADGIALYANWGEGFHSNDARGVTNPIDPAPGLVEGTFKELGARFERGGLILTGVYWWSTIDSELIYVGDSGAVEPSDPGKRHGYELTGFWQAEQLAGDRRGVDRLERALRGPARRARTSCPARSRARANSASRRSSPSSTPRRGYAISARTR